MSYSNITFRSGLSDKGIKNPGLLKDINDAAKNANVVIDINSTTGGGHANNSRHKRGYAVDIWKINQIAAVTTSKEGASLADKFVGELEKLGYSRNKEIGNIKAVLWRMKGHFDHIHVSNKEGESNDGNNASTPSFGESPNQNITENHTGIKYLQFDEEFINRGINLYKEYFNKQELKDNDEGKKTGGSIGFVPLSLNITFDGISGWVIYDKLIINQNILPPQYPENFNFVITGINHNISGHDWVTNIETISVPDVDEKIWVNNNPSKVTETTSTFNSSVGSSSSITTVEQDSWMKMVYQAFVAAGFNPNQSKILTAEVGRENAFDPNYLFGGHNDPKRGYNLGMISWQGARRKELIQHLKQQKLFDSNGNLIRSQQCLNAQARFIKYEMNNKSDYKTTKKYFLNEPNVSYETGSRVLGTNFIRWAIDEPPYSITGKNNRNLFYNKIKNMV